MVKKLAMAVACLGLLAAGLYALGFRVALDGSGKRPGFLTRHDYSALEADRARQREQPLRPPAVPAESQAVEVPGTQVDRAAAAGGRAPTAAAAARPAYWPDFRGPNRDGRYTETPIRIDWPREGLPQLWKQPIGEGYASFVVAEGRAFTIEQRRNQEVVSAYDLETGRELWTNGWNGEFRESLGGDGPRATPTYHQGRLYALGALGELRCIDARNGSLIWRRNILTENNAQNLSWGMSASPLVVDDTVIVLPGGADGKSVAAYNKMTGAPAWTALDDPQAYTSPMLVTLGGVRQILIVSAVRAVGLSADDHRVLWEYPWETSMAISVSQPLIIPGERVNDRVFLSAGYGHGAAVFELVPTGNSFQARRIWENTRMKNKFSSSVLHDGYIYGLDESILACLDAATGELKWKGGRYGYGQLMLAGDHLIVLTEEGDVVLVQATPESHKELASFPAISGKTWNHPVIAGGRLLIRNVQEMAAFDISPRR